MRAVRGPSAASSSAGVVDLDHAHADRAQGGVVDVARVLGDDDLVLGEPVEVRDADVQVGVAAGHAGGGGVGEGGRAARGDEAPLRARERGQARADRVHQLVEVHVVLRGRRHGRAHLGQHRASRSGW